MTIKHLVIPGGGPTGVQALGALRHLEEEGYWSYDDIETIYSTSIGAVLGVLLCLRYDWDIISDYIVRRPWHDAVHVSVGQVFEAYGKMGLFDASIVEMFFSPFFLAKDIPMTITLEELYKMSNVELHVFTLDINSFEVCDISYITHPSLLVVQAIQMSAALPFIMCPVCVDGKCYVDGGIVCNYPLKYCIDRVQDINEIFGIKNNYNCSESGNQITSTSTILDYAVNFMSKLVYKVSRNYAPPNIPHELQYDTELQDIGKLKMALGSPEKRAELMNVGKAAAIEFLKQRVLQQQKTENMDTVTTDVCSS